MEATTATAEFDFSPAAQHLGMKIIRTLFDHVMRQKTYSYEHVAAGLLLIDRLQTEVYAEHGPEQGEVLWREAVTVADALHEILEQHWSKGSDDAE